MISLDSGLGWQVPGWVTNVAPDYPGLGYWLVQLVLMLSMLLAAHCLRNMFMLFSRDAASLETLTQNPLPALTSAWTGYFC